MCVYSLSILVQVSSHVKVIPSIICLESLFKDQDKVDFPDPVVEEGGRVLFAHADVEVDTQASSTAVVKDLK